LQWFVLAILAFVVAAAAAAGPWRAPLAMEVAWLVVVPLCVAAAVWVSSPRRSERLSSLPCDDVHLRWNPRTWPDWLWQAGRAAFSDAVGGVVIVRPPPAAPAACSSRRAGRVPALLGRRRPYAVRRAAGLRRPPAPC